MEIVGGEKREKDFLASLSSSSFPALLDTLFHRREIHRGTRSSSRPISRYPVGKNRSSCLSTSQGGARYARCRPVIKNKAAAIINSATRMLETLVSIVETFERNGHILEENCYSFQVKEKKNLLGWISLSLYE